MDIPATICGSNARTTRNAIGVLLHIGALFLIPSQSFADGANYRLDPSHKEVVALFNLGDPNSEDCSLSRRIVGRIVNQSFDQNGFGVIDFVIEKADGTREIINVRPISPTAPIEDQIWINRGLRRLLAKGNRIEVAAWVCAATDGAKFADEIIAR